jgi:hypothetical protein
MSPMIHGSEIIKMMGLKIRDEGAEFKAREIK